MGVLLNRPRLQVCVAFVWVGGGSGALVLRQKLLQVKVAEKTDDGRTLSLDEMIKKAGEKARAVFARGGGGGGRASIAPSFFYVHKTQGNIQILVLVRFSGEDRRWVAGRHW